MTGASAEGCVGTPTLGHAVDATWSVKQFNLSEQKHVVFVGFADMEKRFLAEGRIA
jgi:hypothetical protein